MNQSKADPIRENSCRIGHGTSFDVSKTDLLSLTKRWDETVNFLLSDGTVLPNVVKEGESIGSAIERILLHPEDVSEIFIFTDSEGFWRYILTPLQL